LKKFATLAPAELQLCNMIRNGLPSKEIARIRHVSPVTVSRQRENIRRKLGITNTGINLTTFLCTFGSE
jgi:DNA-binding CsgD family transcriptional regulator